MPQCCCFSPPLSINAWRVIASNRAWGKMLKKDARTSVVESQDDFNMAQLWHPYTQIRSLLLIRLGGKRQLGFVYSCWRYLLQIYIFKFFPLCVQNVKTVPFCTRLYKNEWHPFLEFVHAAPVRQLMGMACGVTATPVLQNIASEAPTLFRIAKGHSTETGKTRTLIFTRLKTARIAIGAECTNTFILFIIIGFSC